MAASGASELPFWLIPVNNEATLMAEHRNNSDRFRYEPLLKRKALSIDPKAAKVPSRLVTLGGAADICDFFLLRDDAISGTA